MDVFCLHEIYTKIYVFCVIYLLTSHRWTIYSEFLHTPYTSQMPTVSNILFLSAPDE